MTVSVTAEFCNLDLVCDPIENHIVCPSDCEPPPEPEPEAEREESRRRSSSGAGSAGSAEPVTPSVIVEPERGSASSVWSSPADRAFSESFTVRVNERGAVEFSWPPAGGTVRVLRSEAGFPTSPWDGGVVVYEGDADGFEDEAVEPGKVYRYAVFYDAGDGVYGVRNLVVAEPDSALSVGSLFGGGGVPVEVYAIALAALGVLSVPLLRFAISRL